MIYAICAKSDIDALTENEKEYILNLVHESDFNTCRISDEGDIILKWNVGSVNPLEVVMIDHSTYTHNEIIQELKNEKWGTEV